MELKFSLPNRRCGFGRTGSPVSDRHGTGPDPSGGGTDEPLVGGGERLVLDDVGGRPGHPGPAEVQATIAMTFAAYPTAWTVESTRAPTLRLTLLLQRAFQAPFESRKASRMDWREALLFQL